MKEISQSTRFVLESIKEHLSLEEFSEFILSIKTDPVAFIRNIANESILYSNPTLAQEVENENDFCNLKVIDFLTYCFTKEEDPSEKFLETYNLLTKRILPAGFITGNFKSISFEQIP